jgi:hypothetical protein
MLFPSSTLSACSYTHSNTKFILCQGYRTRGLCLAGARSGEYGGWSYFCFPAWRPSWKTQVLQTWRQSKNVWQRFCDQFLKRPLLTVSRSFMNVANSVLWMMAIILKANKVNLFVSSVLFVFWYHSPNVWDTLHIKSTKTVTYNSGQSVRPTTDAIIPCRDENLFMSSSRGSEPRTTKWMCRGL